MRISLRVVALAVVCLRCCSLASAVDVRSFPVCNGECAETPDGALVSNIGTPFVIGAGCSVTKTNDPTKIHSGNGAFVAAVDTQANHFTFWGIAWHGFAAGGESYWQSRDLSRIERFEFWLDNRSGETFRLKLEWKDYRNSGVHQLTHAIHVSPAPGWRRYEVDVDEMIRNGSPDLARMRFLFFVIEETLETVAGNLLFDDVAFREIGDVVDSETASDAAIMRILAERATRGLWGSRDRDHGLVPLNSAYADVSALNSTGGLIALLPVAVEKGWLNRDETDAYVARVCGTLQTLMATSTYLPPRYVESRTLAPKSNEESSVDAAILALALVKYRVWLAGANPSLRGTINATLGQFNFRPFFVNGSGFHHAWLIAEQEFTPGFYDSYSTEVYVLALTAQIAGAQRVAIANSWNTGVHRVRLGSDDKWFLVAETTEYRSPFMQFLFNLFVNTSALGDDSYPDPQLRRNCWRNALYYQRFVTSRLRANDRGLQPDAGIDLAGTYGSYSWWHGPDNLHMPWSATFARLANTNVGLAAIRAALADGHHSLFALSESVQDGVPVARADLWNVSLGALALTARGAGGNRVLSENPNVDRQLAKVFPEESPFAIARGWLLDPAGSAADAVAASAVQWESEALDAYDWLLNGTPEALPTP